MKNIIKIFIAGLSFFNFANGQVLISNDSSIVATHDDAMLQLVNTSESNPDTRSVNLPVILNESERPVNPAIGLTVFQSDIKKSIYWDGVKWLPAFDRSPKNFDASRFRLASNVTATNVIIGFGGAASWILPVGSEGIFGDNLDMLGSDNRNLYARQTGVYRFSFNFKVEGWSFGFTAPTLDVILYVNDEPKMTYTVKTDSFFGIDLDGDTAIISGEVSHYFRQGDRFYIELATSPIIGGVSSYNILQDDDSTLLVEKVM